MKILVTGGLGFIGSHTVVELLNEGFEVIVIDNLSNSLESVLDGIRAITNQKPIFKKIDLREKNLAQDFFSRHNDIEAIIHFAALKAVNESAKKPLLYYENNLHSLIFILQQLQKKQTKFIFSSSCTVYGQAENLPIKETDPIKQAQSIYGNTKQIGEEIIRDTCSVNQNIQSVILRYFNPIGADPSGEIGELPIGIPQNLIPFITQTAIGLRKELLVFGNDYPTKDGTCIRDYIHVVDLARAHVLALNYLIEQKNKTNFEVFNVGTGKGSSVLEVIDSFERINNKKLNWKFAPRREGDVTVAFADVKKINTILNWKAQFQLDDALISAWKWEKKMRNRKANS